MSWVNDGRGELSQRNGFHSKRRSVSFSAAPNTFKSQSRTEKKTKKNRRGRLRCDQSEEIRGKKGITQHVVEV